jgi:hypothetical protein
MGASHRSTAGQSTSSQVRIKVLAKM